MSRSMLRPAILSAAILMTTGCVAGASNGPPTALPSAVLATAPPPPSSLAAEPSAAAATEAPATEPPVAELVIGGVRYPGTVGGYTWDSYSQSAPWLPAPGLSSVDVPAGADVLVELAGGLAGIDSWTAKVAGADDPAAATTQPLGSGSAPVAIVGPGSGDWVMEVRVTYADGRGDGAYYWRLVVP